MNKLSLHDFKNWLSKTDSRGNINEFFNYKEENPYDKFIGKFTTPKVSTSKLIEKVETDGQTSKEELISEFEENGGTIVSAENNLFVIETELGSIKLPRFCLKITKN